MIVMVAGTRPEIIKVAPVLKAVKTRGADYQFVWSGQHFDYNMSKVFFDELKIDKPDVFLKITPGQESLSIASALSLKLKELIKKLKPSVVYAQGDTTTVIASSLASNYSQVPFFHDEAGMRSYDNSMEEEVNRRVADTVATLHLCPTKVSVMNLLWEGFSSSSIKLVGSAVVDSVNYAQHYLRKVAPDLLKRYGLEKERYVLFTVHRRQTLQPLNLAKLVTIILMIAKEDPDKKIIFPIHPHTRKKLRLSGLYDRLFQRKNVLVVEPLGYLDFLSLLQDCILVITDSGGVQQEAFVLGKVAITLREITEWPETVLWGSNVLAGLSPKIALEAYHRLIAKTFETPPLSLNPLGDGKTGQRVAKILAQAQELKSREFISFQNSVPAAIRQLETGIAIEFSKSARVVYNKMNRRNRQLCLSMRDLFKALGPSKSKEILQVDWKRIS
jgi:UDP-N-acetylglucosamine 2-epimerase (non-hydrolysing)